MEQVVRELRRTAMLPDGASASDGHLLERFIADQDAVAFEALVRRHGAMVLGVCRRVTGHVHDAEDAFQAAFLVLARKAAAVRPRELLGNWLYGVAWRSALEARTKAARRTARERPLDDMLDPHPSSTDHREACAFLDQELGKLPDKYRSAIVLCELEGRPRQEVADRLGIPAGTLSSRLAYARKLLAQRLTRRGVVLPAAGVAALAAANTTSAELVATTVTTCVNMVAGQAWAAAGASTSVLKIAEGVMKTILLGKLKKSALLAAAALCLAGLGAWGVAAADSQNANPLPPATKKNEPNEQSKAVPTDEQKLQGVWEITSYQVREAELKGQLADQFKAIKFVFKGNRLNYDGKGEDGKPLPLIGKQFKLKPKESPKHIDLLPLDAKDNAGKTMPGLYEVKGDELKLCLAQSEDRPKALASDKSTRDVFLVLKRVAPKASGPSNPQPRPEPPGEGRLMIFRDGALATMNPDGKDVRWLLAKDEKVPLHPFSNSSLSPDGKRLALLVIDVKAMEAARATDKAQRAIAYVHIRDVNAKGPGENLGVSGMTCLWSGDSAKLLVSDLDFLEISRKDSKATDADTKAWIIDVKTKEKTALELPKNHLVIDWSRDGRWLLSMTFDQKAGTKLVMLKKDGAAQYDVTSPGQIPSFGKLSPDGKKVLYVVNQKDKKSEQQLVVQSLIKGDNAEPVRISALNHDILGFAWSPNGRRIAYTCKVHQGPDLTGDRQDPVEAFLVVADADGANAVTVQTEKGPTAYSIPLGSLEWR